MSDGRQRPSKGCSSPSLAFAHSLEGCSSPSLAFAHSLEGCSSPSLAFAHPFEGDAPPSLVRQTTTLVPRMATVVRRDTKLTTAHPCDSGLCSGFEGAPTMLTPEDLWNRLVEEAGEDAVTDATSVQASQAEQYLKAAGFD